MKPLRTAEHRAKKMRFYEPFYLGQTWPQDTFQLHPAGTIPVKCDVKPIRTVAQREAEQHENDGLYSAMKRALNAKP